MFILTIASFICFFVFLLLFINSLLSYKPMIYAGKTKMTVISCEKIPNEDVQSNYVIKYLYTENNEEKEITEISDHPLTIGSTSNKIKVRIGKNKYLVQRKIISENQLFVSYLYLSIIMASLFISTLTKNFYTFVNIFKVCGILTMIDLSYNLIKNMLYSGSKNAFKLDSKLLKYNSIYNNDIIEYYPIYILDENVFDIHTFEPTMATIRPKLRRGSKWAIYRDNDTGELFEVEDKSYYLYWIIGFMIVALILAII